MTAYFWQRGAERQLAHAPGGRELTIDGRAPAAGEIFRNPGLARTLRTVAEGGKEAFYQGPIAEAIAATVQQAGGCLTADDLASHTAPGTNRSARPTAGCASGNARRTGRGWRRCWR